MLGAWTRWYERLAPDAQPSPYGASESYQRGADWLKDCKLIQDWGCGTGWLRTIVPPERYLGIDGTVSPFADVVTDLRHLRSETPGLFMRHVLEHNHDWRDVLDATQESFTRRMALILFTPMSPVTREHPDLAGLGGIDVPVISFAHADLVARFAPGVAWTLEDLHSPETFFGVERIYYLERT